MAAQKQKATGSAGLGVGVSSVLVIFVLLCLVTFAALSLASASADQNLSQKAAQHTLTYTAASNRAEATLAQADAALQQCYTEAGSKTAYLQAAAAALASYGTTRTENDMLYLDYTVPISDTQRITASLEVLWPGAAGDGFYRIARWQTESTGEWQPQDGLPVYGSGSSAVGALPGKP